MRLTRPIPAAAFILILASTAALLVYAARAPQNAPPAQPSPSPLYIVSFIDYAGGADLTAEGTKQIQQYVLDTRKDPGIIRCEALSQLGRANHLVVIEVWQNQAAFDNHEGAAHTKAFRANIQSKLGAPFDQRLHALVE